MANDVAKAWVSVTAQATADFALTPSELALIHSITQVIEANCFAAVSMTTKR
jgi:hypothetical protein